MQHEEPEETVVGIRYGELFLKSEPVKRRFIGILTDNIERALKEKGISFWLEHPRGRIIVHGEDASAIAHITARVFGVVDTGICLLTGTTSDELARSAINLAKKNLSPGMTFAVRAKREKKEGIPSPELAAFLGSEILREIPGLQVDLDHPSYELHVEVRGIGGLICDQRVPAPGGLPFGTQGIFLSLLSSGIDSPVAAWMMMKRGCVPHFLFLDAEIWSGVDVRGGAIENFRRLSLWCPGHSLEMDIVPNKDLFQQMNDEKIPPRFRCVICKRFMYRVASAHAKQSAALALVTGENLGQVASQTLVNLATISEAATIPVLRPLITYDKREIIDRARKIGTFPGQGGDLSCRAVPHKPSTGANLGGIKTLEKDLDIPSLVRECSERAQTLTARDGRIIEEYPA
ncbi:MAG: tRNA 4-thiouridine(8) synthase ThiI [Methanomicrobiales archaeon]|nr:tRNA 4-thiouridine(8) synthase ThiI [Methanomicrobiales archaeon]